MRLCSIAGLTVLAAVLPSTLAWGADGHRIVATIAQAHLHPETIRKLSIILPPWAKGHLASVAAWADTIRREHPELSKLHYINPNTDYPPSHCSFGEDGWSYPTSNIITGIWKVTQQLIDGGGDIPLRFLVHFFGDLHQPLHLTGRHYGGNQDFVTFDGRHTNLHSVWDSLLINQRIRELSNYTTPLPSKRIESALRGNIYDPYVRWIITEGIQSWWATQHTNWVDCPLEGDHFPAPTAPSTTLGRVKQLVLGAPDIPDAPDPNLPACPFFWASDTRRLTCQIAFPASMEPIPELSTPEYLDPIHGPHLLEKTLAVGGIRLAAVLNQIYGPNGTDFWQSERELSEPSRLRSWWSWLA